MNRQHIFRFKDPEAAHAFRIVYGVGPAVVDGDEVVVTLAGGIPETALERAAVLGGVHVELFEP